MSVKRIAERIVVVALLSLVLVAAFAGVALATSQWSDIDAGVLAPYGLTESDLATISEGYDDGTWRPYNDMPRRQFVKMAVTAFDIPTATPATPTFSDVSPSDEYYPYIEGAVAAGLIEGTGGGLFQPNAIVSRQQGVAIVARRIAEQRMVNLETRYTDAEAAAMLAPFSDAGQVSPELTKEMAFAVEQRVVNGSAGKLNPTQPLMRIQGAAVIVRAMERLDQIFDADFYEEETVDVGDEPVAFRAYRDIVYVEGPEQIVFPLEIIYQKLNVYVPVDIDLDEYSTDQTPIFLPNTIGGYNPGLPAEPADRAEVRTALAKGYVVVAPGARGRTNYGSDALFNGKAPAAIVDLKAAVRYLRFNDAIMPGSAEKIISSGTSAGGAISSLLGTTGNSKDYEPYLEQIGAAETRDDIFATNAYCPITNLDNADTAYEWHFYGLNDYTFLGGGTMTGDRLVVSEQLKDMFPAYVNGLELHDFTQVTKDIALTLDADGEGTFKDYVKTFIIDSAQTALDKNVDLSGFDWITIEDDVVTDVDWDAYVAYQTRMKPAPAFDGIYGPSWENSLFGTAQINDQHFTQYSYTTPYGTWEAPLAAQNIVKMMNPMDYIGVAGSDSSEYWRIRHGAIDRDTSVAIPVILATKLMNTGHTVDFAVPWGQGHGGNYDLEELFDWIASIT